MPPFPTNYPEKAKKTFFHIFNTLKNKSFDEGQIKQQIQIDISCI